MEEYSRIQIQEMCKLAMPNGLKDLMADISREVLRAQPTNLYSFIAQYLKALLRARESLCIATQVCCDICDDIQHPPLQDALKEMGFSDEDVGTIVGIVVKFFEKHGSKDSIVEEGNLLARLIKKVDIPEDQMQELIKLIKRCYLDHKLGRMPERTFKCVGYSRSKSDVMTDVVGEEEIGDPGPSKIKFGFSENYSDISLIKREDLHEYDDDDENSSRDRICSENTRASISIIGVKSPRSSEERSTDSKEVVVNEVDYKESIDRANSREKPALCKKASNIRKSIEAIHKQAGPTVSDVNLKSISFHAKDERIIYDAALEADDESNNSSVVDESIMPESEHDDTSIIDDDIESPGSIEKGDEQQEQKLE